MYVFRIYDLNSLEARVQNRVYFVVHCVQCNGSIRKCLCTRWQNEWMNENERSIATLELRSAWKTFNLITHLLTRRLINNECIYCKISLHFSYFSRDWTVTQPIEDFEEFQRYFCTISMNGVLASWLFLCQWDTNSSRSTLVCLIFVKFYVQYRSIRFICHPKQ